MPRLNWIKDKYFYGQTPRQINCGNCFNWAYIAYLYYNRVKLYTFSEWGGHAFIKIGQYYYDAENPYGVKHWALLKSICAMGVYNIYPRQKSINSFLNYWKRNGRYPVLDRKYIDV